MWPSQDEVVCPLRDGNTLYDHRGTALNRAYRSIAVSIRIRPREICLYVVQAGTKPPPGKLAEDKRVRSWVDEVVTAVVQRLRVTTARLSQV